MKSYVEIGPGIDKEEDIFKALWFQYWITGETSVILDAGQSQVANIYNPFKLKMVSHSAHDIRLPEELQKIIQLSGISKPDKFTIQKL